ncbi:toxin secretion/phage lysis holin [Paenibacillus alvei DSM 29]|uniref:phage holin family protein n=1 Tax=Paenibacillus alvei TaxID=44250 RepID=UPI00028890C1|nr:phage holin family protein [Paenibacillus alvei]EJW14464.1 toxin secretion/phage lysis holin [Paenibacillus alvei DSM 29]
MEKYWAFLTGAIITPAFNFLYGSGETSMAMLAALVFFLVMDWVTGIRAAKKDNTYASSYGIDGIFRSFFILLLPAGGNLLDKAFQLPGVLFWGAMHRRSVPHSTKHDGECHQSRLGELVP